MVVNNLKIEGHMGTWCVIDENIHRRKKIYLLESEQYGEEAPSIIVDKDLNVILEDVWNGFDDLD